MKTEQPSMSYKLNNTIIQFHKCNNCELLGSERIKSELWIYIYYILHSFKYGMIAQWWSVMTETCSYSLIKNSCDGWTIWRFIIEINFFFWQCREWPDSRIWHIYSVSCSATWIWNPGWYWHQHLVYSVSCCPPKNNHRKPSGKLNFLCKVLITRLSMYSTYMQNCKFWWFSVIEMAPWEWSLP